MHIGIKDEGYQILIKELKEDKLRQTESILQRKCERLGDCCNSMEIQQCLQDQETFICTLFITCINEIYNNVIIILITIQ